MDKSATLTSERAMPCTLSPSTDKILSPICTCPVCAALEDMEYGVITEQKKSAEDILEKSRRVEERGRERNRDWEGHSRGRE